MLAWKFEPHKNKLSTEETEEISGVQRKNRLPFHIAKIDTFQIIPILFAKILQLYKFIRIFASFIPTPSGEWVGRRHIGKRH